MKVKSLSRVRLLATPWTVAYQAPPSVGFSRHEYWSGVPLPSPNECLTTVHLLFDIFYILPLQTMTMNSSQTFFVIINHDNEINAIYFCVKLLD